MIIEGQGSFVRLSEIIEKENPKSIFLVTGKKSYENSNIPIQIKSLCQNINVTRFSDFRENPLLIDAERGFQQYKENNCDFIIAIGGGSVIDMAKIICSLTANDDIEKSLTEGAKVEDSKTKLVAIPTTSGTGSEATHFAVLYIGKKKYSLAHKTLLPEYVILDSDLTQNVPDYLTAVTGVDALSQAMESMWSVNSTEESVKYAREALSLIFSSLKDCVNSPTYDTRESMMKGAYLAGKAINISKTTAPHAFSYTFTSYNNLPHGHAVAITLPFFLKYNYELTAESCNDNRGADYVRRQIDIILDLMGGADIDSGVKFLSDLFSEIGVEINPEKLGMNQSDINRAVENVNFERLKNNPRKLEEGFMLSL